ncbi:hypothetical protein L9F63_002682, partial [Diploptera punctata]
KHPTMSSSSTDCDIKQEEVFLPVTDIKIEPQEIKTEAEECDIKDDIVDSLNTEPEVKQIEDCLDTLVQVVYDTKSEDEQRNTEEEETNTLDTF